MRVQGIDAAVNPFGASGPELLAHALDDAGVLGPATTIDGRPARDLLRSFHAKREEFRESTRLGGLLVSRGVLDRQQLVEALRRQRELGGARLGDVLVELGFCRREDLAGALATQAQIRHDIDELATRRSKIEEIARRLEERR